MIGCALPLLALVGGLMFYQFETQRRQQLDLFAADLSEGQVIVDGVVKQARDHIGQLREQAADLLAGRLPPTDPRLPALLSPSAGAGRDAPDGLTLDGIANKDLQQRLGNMFVATDRLDRTSPAEIAMALALFEPMRLRHRSMPNLRWSYFLSASGAFITMFPFVPRDALVEKQSHGSIAALVDDYLSYGVFVDGTPARNPDHSPYWTLPYQDAAGAGWMVSHVAPLVVDGRFLGTLGTDFLLSFLDTTLKNLPLKAGELWIIGPGGELIADRDGSEGSAGAPRNLAAVLPWAAAPSGEDIAAVLTPGRHRLGDQYLFSGGVAGTPWTLLYAVPDRELNGLVLGRLAPYAVILVGILLTIFAAHLLLRRQIIQPALGLVEHLEAESRNEAVSPGWIAPLWKPWYELVTGIFARNRSAMAKLSISEARYRNMIERHPDFVIRMSPDGYLSFANEAYCRFLGRSREVLLSPDWCDIEAIPEGDRERYLAHLARLTPEKPTASIELQSAIANGDRRWSSWTDTGIFDDRGKLVEVQSLGRDITERVLAEKARHETERLRETALEAALDGYVSIDHEGNIIEINAAAETIFGHDRAEMIGRKMADVIIPPSMRAAHQQGFARHLADGSEHVIGRRIEVPALHASGREFPIELVIGRSMRGEHPIFMAYLRDLTGQKRAALALAESEAQFRAIAEGVPVPVIISAIEKPHVLFVNEPARTMLGLEVGQTGAVATQGWVDPAHRAAIARKLMEDGFVDAFEAIFKAPHGEPFEALISARRIEQNGVPAMLAAVMDISRQRKAEAEIARQRDALHQSEKLSALGSLLAGVAHELNNPLSVVVGYSSMLKEIAPNEAIATRAEKIHAAAERCSRIVRTFLAMARKKPPTRGPVDINEVVRGALELAAYGLRSAGVEIRTELAAELPTVWGDADQLHQVFTNLVVNAQQALLLIEPPRKLVIVSSEFDGEIEIVVADNGPGMPEDVRARIFEPFYTTKPAGVGTGVGLSVCNAIVTAHEGRIEVDSAKGAGARFTVTLPVRRVDRAQAQAEHAQPAAQRSARILVVDDEPDISGMIADLLKPDGHDVIIAKDAYDALDKVRTGGVDLVVSDIRMPGLDGPGLYRALSDTGHAPRVVFVTGDTLSSEIETFIRDTGAPVMEKPLDPPALRRVVAERLAAVRESADG